jgi:predicted RNA-binding Zn ribbon-like protein
MKALLIAGHPALELVNTSMLVQGQPTELIGDGDAFLEWLVDAAFLDAAVAQAFRRRLGANELDGAAAEARKIRSWFTSWLSRWTAAPGGGYDQEIDKLNGLLRRGGVFRQVVRRRDGSLAFAERPRGETVGELVAVLATSIADLVVREDPSLVKPCAGTSCTLWFLDRTKAHRRRFCSATACGNREKVAAFRERQRRDS